MALVLADRVLETTTSTGSGTITLAGAEPGYQSFAVVGNGNETYYTIAGDTEWEVGIGTYTSSGTTLSRDTVLSSSNSGNKVTFSAGSKKVFVTYPSEKSVNFNVSGNINVSSAVITDVGYPSADSDAATKLYVDNMSAAALHVHEAVVLTTPADTGRADTYNNGTAGVSATLTATANGTLVIDSTVAQAAQRVLIKDCTNQVQNGVYVVTTVGTASTPYVMTRSSDADTYGEGGSDSLDLGSYFFTTGGTSQKGAAYVCNTPGVIVFGSTAITFAEFSQAQVYSAGNGISITNSTIALVTPVSVANGGTGQSAAPSNGQLLIGNGVSFVLSTLTAGSGVSITNSAGSITLSATGSGGTVTAVTATGPLASSGGTTPDISIANSTGTGSVVLDQGATISSATITAAVSASITTITGTSANITTVTGTTAGFSSANITQLSGTSAGITTVSGTTATFSSGTITQFGATSATITSVSGTNVTYSNGNFTSATITTASGTNLSYGSATITTGNLAFTGTAQRITGDFTNATFASRLMFQNSVTNGASNVQVLPNGTGSTAGFLAFGSSDPANSSFAAFQTINASETRINSGITGTGTYAPITFLTGGSERVRIDTSGNVGIGTASPTTMLHLAGSAAASKDPTVTLANTTASTGRTYQLISGDGGPFRIYDATAAADRIRIDTSGNVGIGTNSPSYKLQVAGSLYQTGDYANIGGYNSGGQNTPAQNAVAFGTNITNGQAEVDIWNTLDPATYANTGILFTQRLSSTTRRDLMFLHNNGNVGLATNSPAARLDIGSGNITFSSTAQRITGDMSSATHANRLSFQSSVTNGSTSPFFIPNGTGNIASVVVANASDPTNCSFGQLIANGSTDVRITSGTLGTGSYLPMTFYNNGAEKARLTTTGNLLVGTTTDVSGVSGVISDVAGNVRAIPRSGSAKTSVYTLAITDIGEYIEIGTGGGIDVPNGIFSTGDAISVFNNTSGARTISLTITTAYIAGTDADKASVSLATRGLATILFISNSVCVVSGNVT